MKNFTQIILAFVLLLSFNEIFGQIGINTTTPSSAAVLHIEARRFPTAQYGGFMMPVVKEGEQALIPVTSIDDGLMVFVSDPGTGKHCLDIYDGTANIWRSINCNSTKTCSGQILYTENFSGYTANTGITGASSTNGDYPVNVTKWFLSSYSLSHNGNPQIPGSLIDGNDYGLVFSGKLQTRDTNGPLLFQTQKINIQGYANISFSMVIKSVGGSLEYDPAYHINDFDCGNDGSPIGNDYVDIEYSTDGGYTYSEVPNYSSLGNSNHTIIGPSLNSGQVNFTMGGLSGTSLVIRVRFQTWADDERIELDTVQVVCN